METTLPHPASKPYARAFVETATARGAEENVLNDISHFQSAFGASPMLRQTFRNTFLREEVRLRIGLDIAPKDASPLTTTFLKFLSKKKRLSLLPDILQRAVELSKASKNQHEATLYAARPLGEAFQSTLKDRLNRRFGKVFDLTERVQPDLKAGIRIQIDDTLFDCSVKNRLLHLSEQLLKQGAPQNN